MATVNSTDRFLIEITESVMEGAKCVTSHPGFVPHMDTDALETYVRIVKEKWKHQCVFPVVFCSVTRVLFHQSAGSCAEKQRVLLSKTVSALFSDQKVLISIITAHF